MPLVVPALRFFVVFLNVYETFKTLKPPPPSARRGGQPSVRALSQRKRDLKGCLAVWIVWCCYAVYERTFDRVVGIFIPFYSEMKSVFLLFLVLTRAKGAEPLFLHVLRPLVKPYAAIVDPMLELSRDMGDFFFALSQVPLDYILSLPRFPSWQAGKSRHSELSDESPSPHISSPSSGSSTRMGKHSSVPILVDRSDAAQISRVSNRHNGPLRGVSDNQRPSCPPSAVDSGATQDRRSSTASPPAYSEQPSHNPPRYSQTLSGHNGHQVLQTPTYAASNYEASVRQPHGAAPEYHLPEWRTYPAFPSAYPPTPLPASASLPRSLTTRSGDEHRLVFDSSYPPILEDEQGFGDMLGRVHEGYSGSVHSSSNKNAIPLGIHSDEEGSDATGRVDEDTLHDESICSSEAGLSEDDFGTSLRTPYRGSKTMPSSAYSSDCLASALATTDNEPSLSTSSDSLSSGSSSLAGQKRSHGASRGKAQSTFPTSRSRNATLRGKPIPLPPQISTSEDDNEIEAGHKEGSANVKRQRVLDPLKRKSTVRPIARGAGHARRVNLSSRNGPVRNRPAIIVTQGAVRARAGSATTTSTIRSKKPTPASHQVLRSELQGVTKSSSTSSAQSGAPKGRAH